MSEAPHSHAVAEPWLTVATALTKRLPSQITMRLDRVIDDDKCKVIGPWKFPPKFDPPRWTKIPMPPTAW